jgi:hypothetical protein
MDLPERIEQKIRISKTHFWRGAPCWEWLGQVDKDGYGLVRWQGRMQPSHRVIYTILIGRIPFGKQLDHLCRYHPCGNPRHLEPVTQTENVRRGISPAAIAARSTECPRGHERTPENTNVYKGWRTCKVCANERSRKWNQMHRKGIIRRIL